MFFRWILLLSLILSGCAAPANIGRGSGDFDAGLKAIEQKNFESASYHFAELSKGGNVAAMNNLGVALLMVDRKDEALYWFNRAASHGEPSAINTLRQMNIALPPIRRPKEPEQNQAPQPAGDSGSGWGELIVEAVILGLLLGVSYKAASYSPSARVIPVIPENRGYATPMVQAPSATRERAVATNYSSPQVQSISPVTQRAPVSGAAEVRSNLSTGSSDSNSRQRSSSKEVYVYPNKLETGCRDDLACNGGRCIKSGTSALGVCMNLQSDALSGTKVPPRPATSGLYTGPSTTGLLGEKGQCEKDYECPNRSRCNQVLKVCVAN